MAEKTKVIQFKRYTKDSKNCNRYEEVVQSGQPPILNQLYVQKWFAGDAQTLTVTITLN